jgi:SAM-dependent methyltransferase
VFAVDLLCATVRRPDLAGVSVLDVGCGTKLVKTILDGGRPIGRYVGVDVSARVIDWLRANVDDPRFEFQHLGARNDLYNPEGPLLSEFEQLPVNGQFDLICLFSVFTHLAPDDFVAMLRLTRRHVKPDGVLLFSLFIDDPTPYVRLLEEALASDDPALVQRAEASVAAAAANPFHGYRDAVPDQPLMQARYTQKYALELIDGTGWEVVALHPPGEHIQHHIICRPI